MPEPKQFKPTEADRYDEALVNRIKNYSGNILNTYKTGKLKNYVGKGHTGTSDAITNIPFVGPYIAESVGQSSYRSRKLTGKISQKELDIFNQIAELQGAKLAEVARSTFTDAQVERIKTYTPNIADDEKTNVFFALNYKLESQLAQSIRTNPEIRKVLDIAAKRQASVAKTLSKDKVRKTLEDQLIDQISKGDMEPYKEYLTERFLGNPKSVKSGHFSPLVYARDRINNFLRSELGFQDVDENGDLVKKLPNGKTAYYDFAEASDGIQGVDVDDDDETLPGPRSKKYDVVREDLLNDYDKRWFPMRQKQLKEQHLKRFGK